MAKHSGADEADGRVPPSVHPTGNTAYPRVSRLDVDILRFMAEGMALIAIGRHVGISKAGLVWRVERLLTLLGVGDREELVAKAKQEGLI